MCDAVLDTGARLGMWWEPALNLVAKPYFKGDSSEPLTCMYDVVYLEIEFVRYRILFSALLSTTRTHDTRAASAHACHDAQPRTST